jgi:uncharacterized membrane protein required for colicin V production
VNPADLALAAALLIVAALGLHQGLLGFLLFALTTVVSLCLAGVAALWVGSESGMALGGRVLAIPVAFFITLAVTSLLLGGLARGLRQAWHRTPAGIMDRLLGAGLAVLVGIVLLSWLAFGVLALPFDNPVTRDVETAHGMPLLLSGGSRLLHLLAHPLPWLEPLADRLAEAQSRLRPPLET